MNESTGSFDGVVQMRRVRAATGFTWLEIMVTIGKPIDVHIARQTILRDIGAIAHRIALALANQYRRFNGLKVIHPDLFRLAQSMKWIPEHHHPGIGLLCSQYRGHPSTHRLTANDNPRQVDLLNDLFEVVEQLGLSIGWSPLAGVALFLHIGKFKPHDANAALGQTGRDPIHKLRIHTRPGAMGKNEGGSTQVAIDD